MSSMDGLPILPPILPHQQSRVYSASKKSFKPFPETRRDNVERFWENPAETGKGEDDALQSILGKLHGLEAGCKGFSGVQKEEVVPSNSQATLFPSVAIESEKLNEMEARMKQCERRLKDLEKYVLHTFDPARPINSSSPATLSSRCSTASSSSSPGGGAERYRASVTKQQDVKLSLTERILGIPQAFPYNFSLLVNRIRDLNFLAGEGICQVVSGTDGAQLKPPQSITLKVYLNGIIVRHCQFRSFSDPTTESFMTDILDGYFPFELKDEYPDGVVFLLEDYHTQMFQPSGSRYIPYSGKPFSLQNNEKQTSASSSARSSTGNENDSFCVKARDPAYDDNASNAGLQSLPRQFVRNGKVIQLRERIGDLLDAKPRQDSFKQHHFCIDNGILSPIDCKTQSGTSILRIRCPSQGMEFLLHALSPDMTIRELKLMLCSPINHHASLHPKEWRLRTLLCSDFAEDISLKQLRLVPRGTLFLEFIADAASATDSLSSFLDEV
ncbi:hypothetical protein BC829DRAFT_381559 [Chytridium lagenaria]|nr:hypothetical protein BC829DRAFT_381559 [Chytridium lagenaria]